MNPAYEVIWSYAEDRYIVRKALTMSKSNDVVLVLGGALFGALYAAMIFFSL